MRMYTHYAENKGWAVNLLDSNPTEIGGFKEVVFEVEGKEPTAASSLKAVSTGFKGCLPLNPAEGYILPP